METYQLTLTNEELTTLLDLFGQMVAPHGGVKVPEGIEFEAPDATQAIRSIAQKLLDAADA